MPAPSDLIHQQSTSTGLGNITLTTVNGKRSFNDGFGTGGTDKFDYFISHQSAAEWERGTGHLSATTTLVRDTVIASSNANAAVSFSAGNKDIVNDIPAALQVRGPGSSTSGNLVLWDDTAGSLLRDSGFKPREVLAANRTYYVRTDGSNSNNGLANTSGGAFLTIQKAVDVAIGTLDFNGFTVTIQVGDGTYAAGASIGTGVGIKAPENFVIKGNTSTPANVLISVTGNCSEANNNGFVRIQDMKLVGGSFGLRATTGGSIEFQNLDFGACTTQMAVVQGGFITAVGNYRISAGAGAHALATGTGVIRAVSVTVTLTGTPAFSTAFAMATRNGYCEFFSSTFSGSATGPRFIAETGGGIFVGGGGASFLPGSTAGTATSPGWYA